MHERYITFNGVTTTSLGLIYSSFTETMPEPKTVYVDVPSLYPVDVSEALGNITYGNGIHVLTFLLYADTQEERLAKKAQITALFHGRRASYTLSWASGTYNGRAAVAYEHRWDNVDVVTVTITHTPYRTSSRSYYVYPTATSKTATTATVYDYLTGGSQYDVSVRLYQSGTARLNNGTTVAIDNTTVNMGTVQDTKGNVPLYIVVNDWWVGSLDDGKLILNATHFPNPTDCEVTTDEDWTRSGTNLACSNYTNQQRAYVSVTARGF